MDTYAARQTGFYGAMTITTTGAKTGRWCRIYFLADTVFTLLTDSTQESGGDSAVTGVTYTAGHEIQGNFTAITLASGKVRAYKAGLNE